MPTYPAGTRKPGQRAMISSAPNSSTVRPYWAAAAFWFAPKPGSAGPILMPPVIVRRCCPVSASSSRQRAYARWASGTYAGDSPYASRMPRERPCDEPLWWPRAKASRPRTRRPRRARWYAAALPIPPSPSTITSYCVSTRIVRTLSSYACAIAANRPHHTWQWWHSLQDSDTARGMLCSRQREGWRSYGVLR